MTSEWREYNGELPETLRTLGAVPVHFGSGWWVRLGAAVLVAPTPPTYLFPPGHWRGISVPPVEQWGTAVKHGTFTVHRSADGHYLRIDDSASKSSRHTWFYQLFTVKPLTLHFAGAHQGLGAASSNTIAAGQAVVSYFTSNACTQASVPEVVTFQNSWNSDNAGTSSVLTVDGQYGPLTQGALQNALGITTVPANCFGGPAQPPGPDNPNPPPPGVLPTPSGTTTGSTGSGPLPYIIGAVVVAGALAAYTYSKKGKRH